MQVALYRGRAADFVLVHAAMRPPRLAEQHHGPLRYIGSLHVDGAVLGSDWAGFADQISDHAFAVVDEARAFQLLGRDGFGELQAG